MSTRSEIESFGPMSLSIRPHLGKLRKKVRQGHDGKWVILDSDGRPVFGGQRYLTPAEALNAARRVIELEKLFLMEES